MVVELSLLLQGLEPLVALLLQVRARRPWRLLDTTVARRTKLV
jgi:hypothetical protein